jgi:hypothetical protein
MVSAWPEPPPEKSAGVREGMEAFALSITKSRPYRRYSNTFRRGGTTLRKEMSDIKGTVKGGFEENV